MRQRRQQLLEQWNSFRRDVIPAEAPTVQVTEMRRAFYAGAQALFSLQMKQLEPGADPTAADLLMMEDLQAELMQFSFDVKAGRA